MREKNEIKDLGINEENHQLYVKLQSDRGTHVWVCEWKQKYYISVSHEWLREGEPDIHICLSS